MIFKNKLKKAKLTIKKVGRALTEKQKNNKKNRKLLMTSMKMDTKNTKDYNWIKRRRYCLETKKKILNFLTINSSIWKVVYRQRIWVKSREKAWISIALRCPRSRLLGTKTLSARISQTPLNDRWSVDFTRVCKPNRGKGNQEKAQGNK